MGLKIKSYSYPYSMLHWIRKAAFDGRFKKRKYKCGGFVIPVVNPCNECALCEAYTRLNNYPLEKHYDMYKKIVGYPLFILQSDCEEGYMSDDSGQRGSIKYDKYMSMETLKYELDTIQKFGLKIDDDEYSYLNVFRIKAAFHDYVHDVMSAKSILHYR